MKKSGGSASTASQIGEDLAERMRGDREMFGEREASDAEDHVTYLIHALQELTPDALTHHYSLRRVQKALS
jgi:hypothetical protein